MASVAIIGGGISGLTTAYFLKQAGLQITIFEASERIGGKIHSERIDGYLIEHGPNSLQTATPLLNQIIEEAGLGPHQLYAAPAAKKRFVVRKGVPEALPMSPPGLLTTNLFSLKSKLKLLGEPFAGKPEIDDESVAAFVKRRLGQEILDYAVDPFVSGIFAGNPETLSIKHAFPRLHQLESAHGSLLKGMLAGGKQKKKAADTPRPKRRIFSFVDGMQMLPRAISTFFPNDIQLNTRVAKISPEKEGWRLHLESGAEQLFDAVVSTLPMPALQHVDVELSADLQPLHDVAYPPVTVFALGFKRDDVDHPLDGFGMLVPGKEQGIRILGTIFSSTVFPNRAPEGEVLLTTLVGGARKGDLCALGDDYLRDFVLDDLYNLLGVHADPVFMKQISWNHAIPQYNVGYGQVKATLDALESQHKGLFFAGNYRAGISVGDAMNSGFEAAKKVKSALT